MHSIVREIETMPRFFGIISRIDISAAPTYVLSVREVCAHSLKEMCNDSANRFLHKYVFVAVRR